MKYLFFVLFVLFAPFGVAAEKLVLTGSSTVAPLVREFGKVFEKNNRGVRIDVQTGGSSRGLADLQHGLNNIAMVSRKLKPEEKVVSFPIARDGIAMIVHSSNPIAYLTRDQVRGFYLGKIRNWQQVGGPDRKVVVVHKADGRSTQEVFKRYFALPSREIYADIVVGDNQQAVKSVASSPLNIGYVSIGSVLASQKYGVKVKMIKIDGIVPSIQAVETGVYPIVRELNLVTLSKPEGLSQEFLKFAMSSEVHDLVRQLSFIPIVKR